MTPEEAQDIARRAYIYGFPMVEHYQLMDSKAVPTNFNTMVSEARLYGPEDTEIVTPNNDTPYSFAWLDLQNQPVVLQVPPISVDRYWSFQIIDYFTNNFSYLGRRAELPVDAYQQFLFVGPGWQGSTDIAGITGVVRCPSQIMFVIGRTQLFGAVDIPNVERIQNEYTVTLLSDFLGEAPPPSQPPFDFVPFDADLKESLSFFTYMNQGFVFQLPPASENAQMQEFARIGVGPGQTFDPNAFTKPVQEAMQKGILEAKEQIVAAANNTGALLDGWNMPRVDQLYFGTTWDDIVFRAAIGYKGIYANSPFEALYPMANRDGAGQGLTGEQRYVLRFGAGQLPPARFFWSLTMYDGITRLLVDNEDDRYSISDRTDGIRRGADGSLTIFIQHAKPTSETEAANWLPSPAGPFYMVLRVYGPEDSMLEGEYGTYRVPPVEPRR